MSPRKSNRTGIKSLLFFPEELIIQLLSYLPVKSLMQFKCVSKSWNTLISDPKFIKLHLQQFKNNSNVKQILCMSLRSYILPFHLDTLLNNPSIINSTEDYFPSNPDYRYAFIGSCNGLICFLLTLYPQKTQKTWFQLWNPATNTLSNKFGEHSHGRNFIMVSGFSFGYDNSTDTYKIVYLHSWKLEIFSFHGRKIIQLPHMVPFRYWDCVPYKRKFLSEGVYLNGTINFLVQEILNASIDFFFREIIAEQIVIISLNLATDAYSKFLPPQDFVEVSLHLPTIHVLGDSLYFSHHSQKTHFIMWKMMEFGIENSWTQFLKISYQDLDIHIEYKYFLAPLCLCESGIALVQGAKDVELQVIVYNWSENKIEKTRMHKQTKWMFNQNYVESLVPTS
ncbi:unnamed protein product [Lathyrus oleraceus]